MCVFLHVYLDVLVCVLPLDLTKTNYAISFSNLPMYLYPAEASVHSIVLKFTGTKTGETHLRMVILGGNGHFYKSQFDCFTFSVNVYFLYSLLCDKKL